MIFFTSTSTGLGRFFASGLVINIWPAGMDQNRFSHSMRQEYSSSALQDDELNVGVRMILEHHGRACNRCGHRRGIDLGSARVFRHAQKHDAVLEIEISSALGKA